MIKFSQLKESINEPTKSLEEKMIDFFVNNPYPEDKQVHQFAQQMKMEPDEIEKEVYKMICTFLCGGAYHDNKNVKIDPMQLQMGKKVEMEHVDTKSSYAPYFAERIGKDHLSEKKNIFHKIYYTLLKKHVDKDK